MNKKKDVNIKSMADITKMVTSDLQKKPVLDAGNYL